MPSNSSPRDPQQLTTYEASCQCGQVSYTVATTPLGKQPITTCDCSICSRNGYALIYVPRAQIAWLAGQGKMKSFRFGVKRNDHCFCSECGSSMLIDPGHWYSKMGRKGWDVAPDILGLNIRMFKDVKMDEPGLQFTTEGWSWKPPVENEDAESRKED